MLFITGLLVYHIYLVSSNITTKEELKNSFSKYPEGNPYYKSCEDSWSKIFGNSNISKKSTFDIMKEYALLNKLKNG
jgi:hypothetical protein